MVSKVFIISPVGLTPPSNLVLPLPKIKEIKKFYSQQYFSNHNTKYEGIDCYYPKWFWLPKKRFWKYEAEQLYFQIGEQIEAIINDYSPDLILTSWLNPFATYSKFIKKKFDIPVISIAEGSDILIYPKKYNGIERISKIVESNVDQFIYVSNHSKLAGDIYFGGIKSAVIMNGYDSDIFDYTDVKSASKEDRLSLNIISVGGHSQVKGHDLLLQAVKDIEINVHLTLCGEGPLTSEYKKFVNVNNLSDKVTFTGNITAPEIKKYLQNSDLYCQPSRSEGIPSAPLEAMACGLPVVAARVGGLPEIIKDHENGLLCEPNSVESLKSAISDAANFHLE